MLFILQFGHATEKESLKTTISWQVKSNDLKIFQILRYLCKVRKLFFPSIWFHFSLLIFRLYLLDDYLRLLLIIYDYWWESFYLNGPSLSCIRLPAPSYTDGGWAGAGGFVIIVFVFLNWTFFLLHPKLCNFLNADTHSPITFFWTSNILNNEHSEQWNSFL